jgi:hypothetical protein
VLDSGCFHTLDSEEQLRYAASLAAVTEPGGKAYVLCFSDQGSDLGPHPIGEADLRRAFHPPRGWELSALEPERIEARIRAEAFPALLATLLRLPG